MTLFHWKKEAGLLLLSFSLLPHLRSVVALIGFAFVIIKNPCSAFKVGLQLGLSKIFVLVFSIAHGLSFLSDTELKCLENDRKLLLLQFLISFLKSWCLDCTLYYWNQIKSYHSNGVGAVGISIFFKDCNVQQGLETTGSTY